MLPMSVKGRNAAFSFLYTLSEKILWDKSDIFNF